MEQAGVDHEALLDTYIRAINVCVQDRPADLQVGVHMCRGNLKVCSRCTSLFFADQRAVWTKGFHFSHGGYGRIAEKVFKNLNVDTYYVWVQS
jgi:methionine synthase II (cobalamin-independent)